jgi:hypothetical protein
MERNHQSDLKQIEDLRTRQLSFFTSGSYLFLEVV